MRFHSSASLLIIRFMLVVPFLFGTLFVALLVLTNNIALMKVRNAAAAARQCGGLQDSAYRQIEEFCVPGAINLLDCVRHIEIIGIRPIGDSDCAKGSQELARAKSKLASMQPVAPSGSSLGERIRLVLGFFRNADSDSGNVTTAPP